MMNFKGSSHTCVEREVVISGIIFHYNSENSIIVWRSGMFYDLQESYDLGLLTQEDLSNIANRMERQPISCFE